MKKFILLIMALSFFSAQAQTKRKPKRKAKAKTTAVAPKPEAPVVEAPVVETPAQGAAVDDTPIPSMSILNAKSPESFRKYREMGMMKQGD